jgi:hypothetical protein
MRIQKAVGLTLALLVCGNSGHLQNPTAPHPATVRKQVTLVAMLVDFSHSSMLMRFVPVKPSAPQLGLKEHQFALLRRGVPHPAGKPSRDMRMDRRLRNRARYAHKSFSDCSSSGVSHPLRRLNDV